MTKVKNWLILTFKTRTILSAFSNHLLLLFEKKMFYQCLFSLKKNKKVMRNAAGKYYSPSISIRLLSDSFNRQAAM